MYPIIKSDKNTGSTYNSIIYARLILMPIIFVFVAIMVLWFLDCFNEPTQMNLTGIYVLMILSSIIIKIAKLFCKK